LLVHLPKRRARRQERAVEMDGKQLLPLGELEIDNRVDDLDAGIADQDVEAAEGRDRLRRAGLDLIFVADVIATPSARCPAGSISRAVASAAFKSRSAIAIFAPSRAKRSAISLPMPLAAPVMIATLSCKRMDLVLPGLRAFFPAR
jgi:hypothetical protein